MRSIAVIFLVLSCISINGCTTTPKLKNADTRAILFPYGTYQHSVRVEIKSLKGSNRISNSQGIAKISATEIKLIALSAFGTTVFRLTENRVTNEIQIETEIDAIKKNEAKLREYYVPMRTLFTMPLPIQNAESALRAVKENAEGLPEELTDETGIYRFRLTNYDENKIARKCEILSEKFDITIELGSYEF